jgi:hypothetical protein
LNFIEFGKTSLTERVRVEQGLGGMGWVLAILKKHKW